jgi:hypothetical protein
MNSHLDVFTAIDKGTLDALCCSNEEAVDMMCYEVIRVLKDNGLFISIGYGTPEWRLCYLQKEKFHWKLIDVLQLPGVLGLYSESWFGTH